MSHGIPRGSFDVVQSETARLKEHEKIRSYLKLVEVVAAERKKNDFSIETLANTSDLLTRNPEFYTVWNTRRLVLQHQLSSFVCEAQETGNTQKATEQIQKLLQKDMQFLFPLLRKHPKCYWIWNHRVWDLEQTAALLPAAVSLEFWQNELALVSKMLSMDSRNFHGWGYRRRVVEAVEDLRSKADESSERESLAKVELDYATKMIGTNLSNFSAWHNRAMVLLRLLDEERASDEDRRKRLDEELKLIHRALIDPYDQSLWFYHQSLMACFDPVLAADTIAPNLSQSERLTYVENEIEEISEMLDGAEDCRWIYQSLIDFSLLMTKLQGRMSDASRQKIGEWLAKLKTLDPLRRARWQDLEKSIGGL